MVQSTLDSSGPALGQPGRMILAVPTYPFTRPRSRSRLALMERFLWICLAGALGSGTRYLVALWAGKTFGASFPWGTLFVNLAGCFLLAIVMYAGIERALLSPNLRFALATGFLGGLTTYSSFNFETTELVRSRAFKLVAMNAGLTTIGCFIAGLCGLMIARRIFGS